MASSFQTIKEEDESQKAHNKYRKTMENLEKYAGWGVQDHLYQYQGFWYFAPFLEGIISAQDHFIAQPSDILLSSPPKTGTTWLKALAFAIVTRTQFDHSTSPLLTSVPHECTPCLEIDLAQPNSMKKDPKLPLLDTHIPYSSLPKSIISSGCKIVYIYREPKDAFVSLWHFLRKLVPEDKEPIPIEEAFRLFCKGICHFGPYWDHVLGYWKASLDCPDKVLILKYENLKADTAFHVKRLADFMGYAFSLEEEKEGEVGRIVELCSFENLSNLNVNKIGKHRPGSTVEVGNNLFFRKGKVGDWRNHLTVEMAEEMDRITEQKFGSCGMIGSVKP